MAKIIAVAGKGGVGKTTLTGLMIQYLCKNGKTPILAVDADANSNLNEVLGVEAPPTLGEIREEIERAGMSLNSPIPAGMTKGDYLQMRLEDVETALRCLSRTVWSAPIRSAPNAAISLSSPHPLEI